MHADFEEFPENQWAGGSLFALLNTLTREAQQNAEQGWDAQAWRILPSGAFVRLKIVDGARQIEFMRRGPFKTDKGPGLWKREVDTFVAKFTAESWQRHDVPGEQRSILREATHE